jgi:dTDP-4-amino-4,6-dideoxygalactose transaminase
MKKKQIWLSPPHMGGSEQKYVQKAFDTNWIAPVGENIQLFEEALCQYTGARYALALSSGTAAIHLALILLGVEHGDEVIVPTFTFSATINPVIYQGAVPIFVDSERESWNICPKEMAYAIENRLSLGRKPKAIIVVHAYGQSAHIPDLMKLANQYNIPVIEDAAEALGATFQGRKLGTFGTLGILSFNGNKIITTSGGGALLCDDQLLLERARYLSTQSRDPAPHFQHSEVGYNYALSNVLAGIGLGQMEVLKERVRQRRAIFSFYQQAFSDIEAISFAPELEFSEGNRWLSCILVNEKTSGGITRETIRLALEKELIEARPLWKPMHQQPVFQQFPYFGSQHVAEGLFNRGLCLPSGSNLSVEDLNQIVGVVRRIFGKGSRTE